MIFGFTAARNIDDVPQERVNPYLDALYHGTEFVTGGCRGGDAYIGLYCYKRFYTVQHTVIVPANRSQVFDWWFDKPDVNVIYMPEGTDYKARNQAIVDRCDELVGFPEYPEEHGRSKRSGTWQTIRLARKAKKMYEPEKIFLLRG